MTTNERGTIGVELLPMLVVVFVVGLLFLVRLWAVLDTKVATATAARSAARSFVEQPASHPAPLDVARAAAHSSVSLPAAASPLSIQALEEASLLRCAPVTFEASTTLDLSPLSQLDTLTHIEIRSSHRQIVDPYRDGLPVEGGCDR